jgi:hypothetical protein
MSFYCLGFTSYLLLHRRHSCHSTAMASAVLKIGEVTMVLLLPKRHRCLMIEEHSCCYAVTPRCHSFPSTTKPSVPSHPGTTGHSLPSTAKPSHLGAIACPTAKPSRGRFYFLFLSVYIYTPITYTHRKCTRNLNP